MGNRRLRFKYFDGPSISERRLRQIWSLRVEMLNLQVPPEDDWRYFSTFVRREDTAVLAFLDAGSQVQGFFTISYLPVEHETRKGLLFFSKYFYFRSAFRGHYKTILAPWVLLPKAWRRYGWRSPHFVTSAYPQSYVSLSRTSGNVVSLHSQHITPWKRAALTQFARTFYRDNFDENRGIVGNQNVVDTPTVQSSAEGRALATEYERLNPDWQKGYTMPILFSVNLGMLAHSLARTMRRALPRSSHEAASAR
ncbi:MAG: hypothetical protein WBG86_10925 [Polyangiales bacterium]